MIVYVLLQGEASEGGRILGVFSSVDAARANAESREHHCPWGEWEPATWGNRCGNFTRLDAGCEWQSIEEWEVTE